MTRPFRLATRASPLALWQARDVARRLRRAHPGLRVTLVPLVSTGDRDLTTPLFGLGIQGVFVKEVQNAVLSGAADAGVHSCKDLPTSGPETLIIAAIPPRADPRDVLIGAAAISALPPDALIGTSSLRRQVQLTALRGDLRFTSLRGNVHTRLRKLAAGDAAASVMAHAGLHRLGLLRVAAAVPLDPEHECTPAPAQAALAIECRRDDHTTCWRLAALDHHATRAAITIERTVLAGLRGGCSLPLGCLARRIDGRWRLVVRLGRDDGSLHTVTIEAVSADGLAQRMLAALMGGG